MFIADAHLDLAYNVVRNRDITLPAAEQPVMAQPEPETATVGLPDLRRGGVGLVCATIFCQPQTEEHPGYTDHAGALTQARRQLEIYQRLWDEDELRPVLKRDDLPVAALRRNAGATEPQDDAFTKLIKDSRTDAQEKRIPIPMLLLMEGADLFTLSDESEDASAHAWFDAGARMVGLAWGRTRFAGGTGAPGPLTRDGRRIVAQLDAAGFIHDASHLAQESLDDLLSLAERPICASHSNCRAIVQEDPRGRHLSDRHIRALAARGGVIGMVLYDKFLLPPAVLKKRKATWSDVVRHVDHICQQCGDCLHVGIGSDLDGGFGRERVPEGLQSAADIARLADALAQENFSDEDVRGIMGGNWLRFFEGAMG